MGLKALRVSLYKRYRRFIYDRIYYSDKLTGDLRFFNLGIAPIDVASLAALNITTEQHQAQVYLEAVSAFSRNTVRGQPQRLLEISTGLGGGLHILSQCFPTTQIVGLDYSPAAIRRSKRVVPTATLVVADAHATSFQESSFPLVVNIESLHALNALMFLREMRRILAADGLLVIVDFHREPAMATREWLGVQARESELEVIEFRDLTQHGIASARRDGARRDRFLKRVPFPFKDRANEMTAGEGSDLLRQYVSGEKTYFLCVLKKRTFAAC